MHILYLHQYFVPPGGSGGTRSLELARRLVAAGHRVTLLTSGAFFPPAYAPGSRPTTLVIDGIRVRVLPVPYANRFSFRRRLVAFADFAARAAWEARKAEGVDVVFATSTPLTIALPAVAAARAHRAPLVFEVRDPWPEVPIAIGVLRNPLAAAAARWLERWAYQHAARVVALSPPMADGVCASGAPAARVHVIPNGTDPAFFEGRARAEPSVPLPPGDGPLVVYAGTLGLVNGVAYLADVARAMRDLDGRVRFLVVGDGREANRVRARAAALGVLGRSFWLAPPVPKRALAPVLKRAAVATSLFIDAPALWANSANKVFDALGAGVPLMINYGGWQADLLRETGAGLVVPPDDPARAAQLLHAFLHDPARRRHAAHAARRLADERFHWDALAARLEEVLKAAREMNQGGG